MSLRSILAFSSLAAFFLTPSITAASPTLTNPFLVSVTYEADDGAPPATDICFSTGTPFEYNIYNTASLDMAFTGPLGGDPVDLMAGHAGGPTSSEHPNQICFFFPNTPIQSGDTLNLVIEAGAHGDPFIGGDNGSTEWTFSEDLSQFLYPSLSPPPHPPQPAFNQRIALLGDARPPQELVPFKLHLPDPIRVLQVGDDMTTLTVPAPGGIGLFAMLACAALVVSLGKRRSLSGR